MQEKKVRKKYYDYSLLLSIIILVTFGLIMIYSASSFSAQLEFKDSAYYIKRQGFFTILGFIAMFVVSRIDYHRILKFDKAIYALSVILLIAVFVVGVERNGKKRWLKFGPVTIQPAEIAKLALILCMSVLIYELYKQIDTKKALFKLSYFVVPLVLLIIPNNMSSAIIVALIPLFMHFSVSKNIFHYVLFVIFVGLVVWQALPIATFLNKIHLVQNYQLQRIIVWKNPEADPTAHGFQVLQGLYAIGSGGFFGRGMGAGMQKFLLPESQNDMIFSIICEELGLFGAVTIMLIFIFLLYRCMVIASLAKDLKGSMIVIGVMGHIAIQLLLNISVVTGLIPNTGIGLPFISYGGTSLLFLMIEMGLVFSVAKSITVDNKNKSGKAFSRK
jgi:cell cycle protein